MILADVLSRRAAILAALSVLIILKFTQGWKSSNPRSRLATMDAIVHDRTLAIDKSVFTTVDKVKLRGQYYSTKPPLLSAVGASLYWPLHHIVGLSFRDNLPVPVYILTL